MLIAQAEPESSEGIAPVNVPIEPPGGPSLSDGTRLGPYSILLKDAFEESQSEQVLQLNEKTSPVDIVAIERSLTPAEQRQGLSQQLITREKIALIVSEDNPFQGTLTLEQVAGIFRGEITNWSQVGGDDRPLTLINRPAQNPTRQALENYGLFEAAQFDARAVSPEQDTTAEILDQLGTDGVSYAPASETIEQFNMRVLTVDNVGVDDGRYPFSLPLNYVYRVDPSPDVQSFLDFLKTPDAQAAIEFAQSQPADPTRALTEPNLSGLAPSATNATSAPTTTTDSTATQTIPAVPLESSTTTEDASSASPTAQPSAGNNSWIPLLLIFLVIAGLGWLAYMRAVLERKRKNVPRPAPDYAARLNAQGSNRDRDELRAIAAGPIQAKAKASPVKSGIPDLSLGSSETESGDTDRVHPDEPEWQESEVDPGEFFWDEDQTELQSRPDLQENMAIPATPLKVDETELAPAEGDDDITVLQDVFSEDSEVLEEPDDNITILQDSSLPGDPQRDSLTGQLTEELETLAELNQAKEDVTSNTSQPAQFREAERNNPPTWEEIDDPWD